MKLSGIERESRNYNIAKIGSPEWRKEPDKPRCGSYMTNFNRCLKLATHIEKLPNGIDYFCDHHAKMRSRQGGTLEPITT